MGFKNYRADDVPLSVLAAFDEAVSEVARSAAEVGGTSVSSGGAFGLLVRSDQLDDAIVEGQRMASAYVGEEVANRQFWVPDVIKTMLLEAAARTGVQVGAAGRLLLIARRDRLAEIFQPPVEGLKGAASGG